MLFNQFLKAVDFLSRESAATLQPNRVDPKLGNLVVSLNMDMRGFTSVRCIEEKPVRPNPQDCRHICQRVYNEPGRNRGADLYG
jgi:hypothetical protein